MNKGDIVRFTDQALANHPGFLDYSGVVEQVLDDLEVFVRFDDGLIERVAVVYLTKEPR